MHPILTNTGRLGSYLLVWIPVGAILAAFLVLAGDLTWVEGSALSLPMTAVYAFLCLSSYYVCKIFPLRRDRTGRLLGVLTAAASIGAVLWVVWATTVASMLAIFPMFGDLPERMARSVFVIFALGVLLYLLAAAFHYVLLSVEKDRAREAQETELKGLAQAAELAALKEQLNPHFLFNSLNSISALTTVDPVQAREMCILLAEFLRKTLGLQGKTSIPLADEVALLRHYLAVEKVRFGERLSLSEEIDLEAAACPIPPLLLQPLVENAVKHGIAGRTDGGLLRLLTRRLAENVQIVLENSFDGSADKGLGVGLANVRKRMAATYGPLATLKAEEDGGLFRVEIMLPYASTGA